MAGTSSQKTGHGGQGKGSNGGPPPSTLEWILAAVGMVLLLASIGYLLHYAWTDDGTPPSPVIRVGAIEQQGGRYVVRLEVSNASRTTAAALRVEGELKRGAQVVERSEMEFDYLPGGSTREAGLFFSNDPRTLTMEVGARSYRNP
jgi:uncharacterized protein (TIGR02588 family)